LAAWLKVGLLIILVFLLADGCVRPIKGLYPPAADAPRKTIFVVSHGWHTGLVLPKADLREAKWPMLQDFPHAEYLEFGWGDAGYYPAEHGTLWLAIKAVCWPTPSVIHVAGIEKDVTNSFPESDVVQIDLSEAGLERLSEFIQREFQLSIAGKPIPAGKGLYGDSRFYQGRSKFYFPKMCNQWTACALRAAGCPIRPLTSVSSGKVISKTKKIGRSIQDK
jgi:uncharacterized protein (TIGR02117 family)